MLNRFGAEAVYGRALGLRELRHLADADQVVRWTTEQQATEMGAWAKANPDKERKVSEAARSALDEGFLEGNV